jgi:hypothetical protein
MDLGEEAGTMEAPSTPSKFHLHVGIPTYGKPSMQFSVSSLSAMMYHIGRRIPEIDKLTLQVDVRTYRQEARQGIVLRGTL